MVPVTVPSSVAVVGAGVVVVVVVDVVTTTWVAGSLATKINVQHINML